MYYALMIDIYLDGADLNAMREGRKNPLVKGFTTNPALIRAAGVTDYETFCREALEIVDGLPISFEVFSDEWDDMERQARKIASWGRNVNVKIPVTNTRGESAAPLVRKLSDSGIMCNVTAVFTQEQIEYLINMNVIISVFAGRIADTGVDPIFLDGAGRQVNGKPKFLWASSREVLNIYQAARSRYDIITVTPDLLKKYEQLKNKDLTEFSLDTVKMFYNDAQKAGYIL
jgi:transaldolase